MSLITISLPFVEAFQRLQLNLFIHSNKVFVSNLYVYMPWIRFDKQNKNKLSNNTSAKYLGRATRSRLCLPNINRTTMVVYLTILVIPVQGNFFHFSLEQLFTSMCPCMCGQELQWREVGGWRWARCRSSWRRRSSASCSTHWWTWWSTQAWLRKNWGWLNQNCHLSD